MPSVLFPSADLKGTEVQYFNLITKHKLEQNWTNCPSIAVHFPHSFSRGYFFDFENMGEKVQPDTIRENVVNIHEPSALFAHSPILEKIGFRLLASGGGESLNRGDFCGENSSLVSIRPGKILPSPRRGVRPPHHSTTGDHTTRAREGTPRLDGRAEKRLAEGAQTRDAPSRLTTAPAPAARTLPALGILRPGPPVSVLRVVNRVFF